MRGKKEKGVNGKRSVRGKQRESDDGRWTST
jgi:hypothetical protein